MALMAGFYLTCTIFIFGVLGSPLRFVTGISDLSPCWISDYDSRAEEPTQAKAPATVYGTGRKGPVGLIPRGLFVPADELSPCSPDSPRSTDGQ